MIVTNNFIFINLPKTGSTFVRETLKTSYKKRGNSLLNLFYKLTKQHTYYELLLPHRQNENDDSTVLGPHGKASQISKDIRKKRIIYSVIRDPLEKLYSHYSYGFWRNVFPYDEQLIKEHFPNYPDITFDEFVRLNYAIGDHRKNVKGYNPKNDFGMLTSEFVKYFFINPEETLKKEMNDDFFKNGTFLIEMYDVVFLRFTRLNEDMEKVLSNDNIVKKIPIQEKKINSSRKKGIVVEDEISEEMKLLFMEKERNLYSMMENIKYI